MYIAAVPNRNSPPAILLREGYREDGKVKTRTLANLSKLHPEAIDVLRQVLKGKQMVSTDDVFEIVEDGPRACGGRAGSHATPRLCRTDQLPAIAAAFLSTGDGGSPHPRTAVEVGHHALVVKHDTH